MNEAPKPPPGPYSGWEYAGIYILGVFVGLICTGAGLFAAEFLVLTAKPPPVVLGYVIIGGLFVAVCAENIRLVRRGGRKRQPFRMGFLTGAMVVSLLMGTCFGLVLTDPKF
jgi:hypothetical protein